MVDTGGRKETDHSRVPWAPPAGEAEGDAGRNGVRTGIGWHRPTRQEEGRRTEPSVLKQYGARAHPNSGAGKIPFDGSNEEAVIEVKDAVRSHTISHAYLRRLRKEAAGAGKQGIYVIKFPDMILECRILPIPRDMR